MPPRLEMGVLFACSAFAAYFAVEMTIKLMGLGPHLYLSDNFNLFDGIVTILGGAETFQD